MLIKTLVSEVVFTSIALTAMVRTAEARPDRESGGILMGALSADKSLVVGLAAGPGRDAECTPLSFNYDPDAQRGFLSAVATAHPMSLAGIWHCHPGGNAYSARDLATFRDFVTDEQWNMRAGIFPILARGQSGNVSGIAVYYLDEHHRKPITLPWRTLRNDEAHLHDLVYGTNTWSCDIPRPGCIHPPGDSAAVLERPRRNNIERFRAIVRARKSRTASERA